MLRMVARDDLSSRPLHGRSPLRVTFLVLLVCSLITGLFGPTSMASANPFSNNIFRQYWQQADYPVAIGAVTRGFTWGPDPFFSAKEPYLEAPGGMRQVEYLDKARMEITRPDLNPSNPYYVTNGLLVKEMVSGLLQQGDYAFSQRFPAFDVPVAGDPVEVNPDAPTYASFYALNSFYTTQPPTVTTGITPTAGISPAPGVPGVPPTPGASPTASVPGASPTASVPGASPTPSVTSAPLQVNNLLSQPPNRIMAVGTPDVDVPSDTSSGLLVRQPDRTNDRVNDTLARSGSTGKNDLLGAVEGANYVFWERTLGHNIPSVFWNYLNQTGPIFNGKGLVSGKVFDWVQTMGYPITDAYWVRTNVAGISRDVMVQLYERRILTYTPTNPVEFRVEMGNVGQHYYKWRYNPKYNLALPLQSNTDVKPEAGFPGATFSIRVYKMLGGVGPGTTPEDVETTIYTPDRRPLVGQIVPGSTLPTGFSFFPVYVRTDKNTPAGQYEIDFKGVVSGNEAKAYFFVLGIPGYTLPA